MTPAKVFSEMKDSGILGCGSIPSHWETIPLKYVALLDGKVDVSNIAPEDMVSFAPMECVRNDKRIPRTALKSKDNGTYSSFCNGDIAIAKVTPCFENGNICMMESLENGYAFGSSELFSVRPQKIVGRYLFYSLQTPYFLDGGAATMTGVGGLKRVSSYYMKNVKIVLPPLSEQSAIAAYLDTQCAKIDEIIVQAKASIEDYKQWKASIIYEAVTKGLDPNVEMKDSGIEWIGKIPINYKVIKLKYVITNIESGVSVNASQAAATDGKVGVLKTSAVSKYKFRPEENKEVNADELNRVACPVKANTVIVSRMNTPDLVGACGYVERDYPNLFLPDRLWQVHFNDSVIAKFVWYYLCSNYIKNYYSSLSSGTSSSMQNISQGQFENACLLLPSLKAQRDIVTFLDKKCMEIDSIIDEKDSLIGEIESYKKSLIYEVVTGKRRV